MAASADDAAAAAATLVRKYAQQEPDSDAEAADGDGVPLLGTSQLNALVKACATAGGREGFFAHKRHGDTVLDRLVAVLNGDPEHVGGKAKLTALAVIAELSRVDSAKDSVLDGAWLCCADCLFLRLLTAAASLSQPQRFGKLVRGSRST